MSAYPENIRGVGVLSKSEARSVHTAVNDILKQGLYTNWQNPETPLSGVMNPRKIMSVRVGEKHVSIVLGAGEMVIKYRIDDPTRVSMRYDNSVPNDELAATRCLFDTEVALVRGSHLGEEWSKLYKRSWRVRGMLEKLGRRDIVEASNEFKNLPGIGRG